MMTPARLLPLLVLAAGSASAADLGYKDTPYFQARNVLGRGITTST